MVDKLLLSMESFGSWLLQQIESKQWRQADLARASNLDSAVISNLVNGRRGPGEDTCRAIAKALGLPPEEVFRAAGLLPPKPETDEQTERLLHLYNQMTDDEREEWVALGEFVFSRRKVKKLRTAEG